MDRVTKQLLSLEGGHALRAILEMTLEFGGADRVELTVEVGVED